jgi:hypothetical protein
MHDSRKIYVPNDDIRRWMGGDILRIETDQKTFHYFVLTGNLSDENIVLQIVYSRDAKHPTAKTIKISDFESREYDAIYFFHRPFAIRGGDEKKLYKKICDNLEIYAKFVIVKVEGMDYTTHLDQVQKKYILVKNDMIRKWLVGNKNSLVLGSKTIQVFADIVGDNYFHIAYLREPILFGHGNVVFVTVGDNEIHDFTINFDEMDVDESGCPEDVFQYTTSPQTELISKLCKHFDVTEKSFYVELGGKKYFYDADRKNLDEKYLIIPDPVMRKWMTNGTEYFGFGGIQLFVSNTILPGRNNYLYLQLVKSEMDRPDDVTPFDKIWKSRSAKIYYTVNNENPPSWTLNFDELTIRPQTKIHVDVTRTIETGPIWQLLSSISDFIGGKKENVPVVLGNLGYTLSLTRNCHFSEVHYEEPEEIFVPEKRFREWLGHTFTFGKVRINVSGNLTSRTKMILANTSWRDTSDFFQRVLRYTTPECGRKDTYFHLSAFPHNIGATRDFSTGFSNIFSEIHDVFQVNEKNCKITLSNYNNFNFNYQKMKYETDPVSISGVALTSGPAPSIFTSIGNAIGRVMGRPEKSYIYVVVKNSEPTFSSTDSLKTFEFAERNGGAVKRIELS